MSKLLFNKKKKKTNKQTRHPAANMKKTKEAKEEKTKNKSSVNTPSLLSTPVDE